MRASRFFGAANTRLSEVRVATLVLAAGIASRFLGVAIGTLPTDRPLRFQLHYNVIGPTQFTDIAERYYRHAQADARELSQARKGKRHASSGPESPSLFGTNLDHLSGSTSCSSSPQ